MERRVKKGGELSEKGWGLNGKVGWRSKKVGGGGG
jgi:hypothetical protein